VLLRRLLWKIGISISGHKRSRVLGTFGISVTSALGASTQQSADAYFDGIELRLLSADGSLEVRLTYDHRVMDGGTAARTLAELEEVLKGTILDELRGLAAKGGLRSGSKTCRERTSVAFSVEPKRPRRAFPTGPAPAN